MKFQPLNRDTERELIALAQAGDLAARDRLVMSQYRLVWKYACKFKRLSRWLEVEDLVQVGTIGLMRAIRKFDRGRNCRLSTYATPWIKQGIRKELETTGVFRLPNKSDNRDQRQDKVDAARAAGCIGDHMFSLASDEPSPAVVVSESEGVCKQVYRVRAAIQRLSPQMQDAIETFLNADTLEANGRQRGITKEAMRQRQVKAIAEIRRLVGAA